MGRAVLAVNNGGPAEPVVHGETGFLCEPTADAFADALAALVLGRAIGRRLGATVPPPCHATLLA